MLGEIFLFIVLGLIIRCLLSFFNISPERIDLLRDKTNSFVFYFIIPLICFKTAYTMPFSVSHLKISIVANLTILSCVAISWFIYKKINKVMSLSIQPEVMGSLIICASFGNVLYVGLPILTKLYGEQGMSYAFTYDFLASTPLTWTVGIAICMKYGKAQSFTLKNSIQTLIKIPPIWGMIIGLIVRELIIPVPDILVNFLKDISIFVTYIMLTIVGLSIKAVSPKKLTICSPAIAVKLIVSPLLAYSFGNIVGLPQIPLNSCMIDAGMPSMLLSMIFATAFGTDMRTSIEMIFLTTAIFLVLFSGYFLVF